MEAFTAVGIASRGIQICQGLLLYYIDWKDYSSDVAATCDFIERLNATLIQLQPILNDQDLEATKRQHATQTIEACQKALDRLANKLDKLKKEDLPRGSGQVSKWRQHIIGQLQRSAYPFLKSTLFKLQEIAANVQASLDTSLNTLQLDIGISSGRKLNDIRVIVGGIERQIEGVSDQINDISVQNQKLLDEQQAELLRKALVWLSSPDPEIDYRSAIRRRESGTGLWLLETDAYVDWKNASASIAPRHIWLCGSAGSGKSVLSATIIEDLRQHCQKNSSTICVMFYFTFTTDEKQSYEYLLRSLVSQLSTKQPASIELIKSHQATGQHLPRRDELERLFQNAMKSYELVYVVIDALDECPEMIDREPARRNLLTALVKLSGSIQSLKILATSRNLNDIAARMADIDAWMIVAGASSVNPDIKKYVASQLAIDPELSKFSASTKVKIQEVLTQKADGMFRWVECQIQALRDLPYTRPSHVDKMLQSLPETLDTTYAYMIEKIPKILRSDALTMLQWLAYSRRPLTLKELAETIIIEPYQNTGAVNYDDRGSTNAVLVALGGLVKIDKSHKRVPWLDSIDHHPRPDSSVRLAHFSVKEYLESDRIRESNASIFQIDEDRTQRFLADSCVIYIMRYHDSSDKMLTPQDYKTFPLLKYAAEYWYEHVQAQKAPGNGLELLLFESEEALSTWLLLNRPDQWFWKPFSEKSYFSFESEMPKLVPSLYWASYFGFDVMVRYLLDLHSAMNMPAFEFSPALIGASINGHERIVQILVEAGANVNVQSIDQEKYTPLIAATSNGYIHIVEYLIANGAELDRCSNMATALQVAIQLKQDAIVKLLIARGANINAEGYGKTAMTVAVQHDDLDMVKLLISHGADVNAMGLYLEDRDSESWGYPLCEAQSKDVAQLLIDAGAEINPVDTHGDMPVVAATRRGDANMIEFLLEQGADINASAKKGTNETALQVAASRGRIKLVRFLLERGANIDQSDDILRGVLNHFQILLDHRTKAGSVFQDAAEWGIKDIIQILLESGINNDARYEKSAIEMAIDWGQKWEQVISVLLDHGADIDSALAFAQRDILPGEKSKRTEVIPMLMGYKVKAEADRAERAPVTQTAKRPTELHQ